MAITNLGAVGISAGGVYNSETVYKKYKVVSANGGSYMYINPTPAAGVPVADTSHWQQIAEKGDQGIQGIQGIQGEIGPQGIQGPKGDTGDPTSSTASDIPTSTAGVSVQGALDGHASQLAENAYFLDGMWGYNLDKGLRKWRYAKARLDQGVNEIINLNCNGDSIFEGQCGAGTTISAYENGFVAKLRAALAAKYGDVGEGFIGCHYPAGAATGRWTYAGTWQNYGEPGWMNSINCKAVSVTGASTATLVFHGTGIVVMLQTNSETNPSTATITVDGSVLETKALYGYPRANVISTITGLEDGEHTLIVTRTAGRVSLLGAYETTTAVKGVRVNRLAAASAKIADMSYEAIHITSCVDYWTPKLTIIDMLANDFLYSTSIANFKAKYQTIITHAKLYGDVLLVTVGALFNTTNQTIPNSDYIQAMVELARDNNIALLDVARRWGGTYAESHALGYNYDGHPSVYGHQDLLTSVLKALEIA